jgi:hypothetical protein
MRRPARCPRRGVPPRVLELALSRCARLIVFAERSALSVARCSRLPQGDGEVAGVAEGDEARVVLAAGLGVVYLGGRGSAPLAAVAVAGESPGSGGGPAGGHDPAACPVRPAPRRVPGAGLREGAAGGGTGAGGPGWHRGVSLTGGRLVGGLDGCAGGCLAHAPFRRPGPAGRFGDRHDLGLASGPPPAGQARAGRRRVERGPALRAVAEGGHDAARQRRGPSQNGHQRRRLQISGSRHPQPSGTIRAAASCLRRRASPRSRAAATLSPPAVTLGADSRRVAVAGVGRRPPRATGAASAVGGPGRGRLGRVIGTAPRVQDQRELVPLRVAGRREVGGPARGTGGQVADTRLTSGLGRPPIR